ncbi:MAG: hypothetical protein ACREBS_08805 [Nitrososphaerales archaeon]
MYSLIAVKLRGLPSSQSYRFDFSEDGILIYKYRVSFIRHDSEYVFDRKISYSDVRRLHYVSPHVSSGSSLGGFVWGEMPADIEIEIAGIGEFSISENDRTEKEFREVYSSLSDRIKLKGGSV